MFYAILDGQRATPQPGQRGAVCELCGRAVIARCGGLVAWHYAHAQGQACDRWAEPETPWHRGWKRAFPAAWCAVPLENHRADVLTPDGRVIEFQHSGLGLPQVLERTEFYGQRGGLLWVLDLTQTAWNFPPFAGVLQCDYIWRVPRRAFHNLAAQVWLHLPGGVLLRPDRILGEDGVRAWHGQGCALLRADWLAAMLNGGALPPPWTPERSEITQQKGRR